jgi:hypothetical protein
MKIISLVLRGTADDKDERCAKLWQEYNAPKHRADQQVVRAETGTREVDQRAVRYETRPRIPKTEQSSVVHMAIDFVGLGQNGLKIGLPVEVDLNWGFADNLGVPCRLYLKEFHLFAKTVNCAGLPGTYFEKLETVGLEIERLSDRWVFRASAGFRLEGKCADFDQLFVIKPTGDADGLPSVMITGVCPGSAAEFFDFKWLETPADETLEADKKAVIERFLAKCVGEGKKGPAELTWAAVDLVEREP